MLRFWDLPKWFAQNGLGGHFLSIHQHSFYTIRSPTSICGPYDQGVASHIKLGARKNSFLGAENPLRRFSPFALSYATVSPRLGRGLFVLLSQRPVARPRSILRMVTTYTRYLNKGRGNSENRKRRVYAGPPRSSRTLYHRTSIAHTSPSANVPHPREQLGSVSRHSV